MDLSVIIVAYRSAAWLPRCLAAVLERSSGLALETIVVDNASDDGTAEVVTRDWPGVLLIRNPENRGFARAANQGFREARGRHLLLLNPDTEVEPGALASSVAYLDAHPDAGIVGARVNNPDGTLQRACRRSLPTPEVAFFRLSGLGKVWKRHPSARAYNLDDADPDATLDVDAVSGAFLMVRREALEKAGPMDERFFLYGEDLDFCWSVRQAGYRVVYYPEAVVVHHKGASSRQTRRLANREFHRAMALFHKKHFAETTPAWLNAAILGGIAIRGTVLDRALRFGLVRHVGSRG